MIRKSITIDEAEYEKLNNIAHREKISFSEVIRKAMNMALEGDVIVIAGKGHETYQILKDETIHFDEREVVYDILEGK